MKKIKMTKLTAAELESEPESGLESDIVLDLKSQ